MRKVSSTLVVVVLALLCLGVVVVASTSSVRGAAAFDDAQYFLKRQLAWLFISLLSGMLVIRIDYHVWRKLSLPLIFLSVVLLALVFVPGIGARIGGSSRWIKIGTVSLQPSEVAKFSVVVAMAAWLGYAGQRIMRFREGLLYPVVGVGVVLSLIMLEPDYGTTALIGLACFAMMFVAGTRMRYIVVAGAILFTCFILAIMQSDVRWKRTMAFLYPDNPEYAGKAYHVVQSKLAFVSGGWTGVGPGNSIQKHLYLPEAHTDFIFAIIGEELGLIATLMVVCMFFTILACGMIIAFKAPDPFGRFLAFGFVIMIVLQAVINIAVVTGCVPTKGIALPFISYGGSSLIFSISAVCVMLNIANHCGEDGRRGRPIKDKLRRF